MNKEDIENFKKQQKYVLENIERIFSKDYLKKEWEGSDPKCGFNKEGSFDINNWNDRRISLFRGFFGGGLFSCSAPIHDEILFLGDLIIIHKWDEDQNYVFIRDVETFCLYYTTWYKNRGRTELILKNGNFIDLNEFKILLYKMAKGNLREEI